MAAHLSRQGLFYYACLSRNTFIACVLPEEICLSGKCGDNIRALGRPCSHEDYACGVIVARIFVPSSKAAASLSLAKVPIRHNLSAKPLTKLNATLSCPRSRTSKNHCSMRHDTIPRPPYRTSKNHCSVPVAKTSKACERANKHEKAAARKTGRLERLNQKDYCGACVVLGDSQVLLATTEHPINETDNQSINQNHVSCFVSSPNLFVIINVRSLVLKNPWITKRRDEIAKL